MEVSLALSRAGGQETVGGLYDIHDYRAGEFGSFSSPQSVRAVVYRAATALTDEFVRSASNGEFGRNLSQIQRPATPDDLVNSWDELSGEWKVASAIVAVFFAVLALGLAIWMLLCVVQFIYWLCVPGWLRQPRTYLPPRAARPRPRPRFEGETELDAPVDADSEDVEVEE